MTLSFPALDPETRRFGHLLHGIGATVTTAVVIAMYFMVYTPMVEETGDSYRQINQLKSALQKGPMIQREHKQLKERLAAISHRIEQIHMHVPEDAMVPDFISQVTAAAEQEGLTISDIDTGKPFPREGYSEREIEFTGTARYANLCRFIHGIRQLPRLSKVTGLEIRTEAYGQEVHPIRLRMMIYFDIRTVWTHQDKEPQHG